MISKFWLGSVFLVAAVVGPRTAHAAPEVTVQPPSFGSVRVANAATTTATRTFNIRNTGDEDLVIDDVDIGGADAGDFAILAEPPTGTVVPPNTNAQVTVIFDPTAPGPRDATLEVTSNDPASPTSAALTGEGTNAQISLTVIPFGIVTHGTTATSSVTVSNTGDAPQGPLHVDGATITGGAGWITFDTNGAADCAGLAACNFGVDVPPDLVVGVRCSPPAGASGSQTATIAFASDSDSTTGAEAMLSCTAGRADITVDPASLAFDDVVVNPATPPELSVTIDNSTGNQTLVIDDVSITAGTFGSLYTLAGCTAGCNVPAGETRELTVTFDPTTPTEPDANVTITIESNDPDDPEVAIAVTARGVAPEISTPAEVALGAAEVGQTTVMQPLTVMNTGTSTLLVTNASFTAGAGEYAAVMGTVGDQLTMIPPMGTATWQIVCTPTDHGPRPGTFRILSDAFTQPAVDVPLTCTGQRGVLEVSVPGGGAAIDFGTVAEGGVATRTFTLANTGNLPVDNIAHAVNPATAGYSIDPAGNPVPATLAAGGSVVLTARFAPQSGTDGGPATIAFTGEWGATPTPTSAALDLDGDGQSAGFTLTETTIDFGDLRFDTTPSRTFCIVNPNETSVQILSPIDIAPGAGTMTGEFAVTGVRRQAACGVGGSPVTLPQTLATNQVLEVTVIADPADRTGMMQATLTVTSNLAVNPSRSLSLLGNSTSGTFTLDPGGLVDFGAVDVQGAAATRTIKITNTGDGPLDLANFARDADPEFTFTLPGDTTLQPTEFLDIVVTYKPVVAAPAGSEEAITLSHSIAGAIAGPSAQMIVIQGRGIDRDLDLAATPVFPDTFRYPDDDDAPVRHARIGNRGEAALKISAAMITNDPDVWQLMDPGPVEIPKDAFQEFGIRFAPKKAGVAPTATLVITHDDDARPPVMINLTGKGIDRLVRLTGGPIKIGFTRVGVPVTLPDALVVTNAELDEFRIREITLDEGPFTIEGPTTDVALPPVSELKFAVTFTPEAQGRFTATARLYLDGDPESATDIFIEGTAVFVDAHGGGGCAAGGAGGGGWVAVLALAVLLGRRRRRAAAGMLALALALALTSAPAPAQADDIVLSVFDPVPATTSHGFQLQAPEVGASGDWVASAVVSHATDPLILSGLANGALVNDFAVISRSIVMNLGGAVAFLGRFEAGARLPLYSQDGQAAGDPLVGFTDRPAEGNARGDLALHGKVRLLRKRLEGDGAFIAGIGAQLTLPTATSGHFSGTPDPSGRVLVLGSLMPGAFERRLTLTMNLGAVIRAPATYMNLEQKSGVAWGLGASVRALDALWLAAEVYGDTVFSGRADPSDPAAPGDPMTRSRVLSPIEWLGGLRWKPDHRFTVGLAAGRGLTSAVGTPASRVVVSLAITPGAPDVRPIRPPKPDGDADGDGVRDSVDRCPAEAEDRDLYDDTDGCPDPDNDGDRIADAQDRCPIEAEDVDGVEDADGCIDKDNDGDGIPDTSDRCPMQAEDKDGFLDTDGCPDEDNDRDGIPDGSDRCVNSPETINGKDDNDGCPDKGESLIVLGPDRLDTLDTIQFTANQKVAKASHNLLGQVGATLRARTEIARLRITVHVQPSNDPDRDQEISDRRAAAVREWLVQWGVAAERLEVRGFGGTKPMVPRDRKGAAAINQRVELIILERK